MYREYNLIGTEVKSHIFHSMSKRNLYKTKYDVQFLGSYELSHAVIYKFKLKSFPALLYFLGDLAHALVIVNAV